MNIQKKMEEIIKLLQMILKELSYGNKLKEDILKELSSKTK